MAKPQFDLAQIVTDKILEALDRDETPFWRKPWTVRNGGTNVHRNFVSKRPYRGINIFLLELEARSRGFSAPYWLTKGNIKQKGGRIRKGEHGTLVVLWKRFSYEPKRGGHCVACHRGKYSQSMTCDQCGKSAPKRAQSVLMRYYKVWNIEQLDGIEIPVIETDEEREEFDPVAEAEKILAAMPNPPSVKYGGDRACYNPFYDHIQLPERENFVSPNEYYSTDFHERVHSTGHEKRINRKGAFQNGFGDPAYAREELVAEMGAAILCAHAGIDTTIGNSTAYIRNWLSKADYEAALREDKRLVIHAAAQAQKAVDFILGETYENGEDS